MVYFHRLSETRDRHGDKCFAATQLETSALRKNLSAADDLASCQGCRLRFVVTDSVYLTCRLCLRTYMEGQRGTQMQHAHRPARLTKKHKQRSSETCREEVRHHSIFRTVLLYAFSQDLVFCCSFNVKHITYLTFKFRVFPLKS